MSRRGGFQDEAYRAAPHGDAARSPHGPARARLLGAFAVLFGLAGLGCLGWVGWSVAEATRVEARGAERLAGAPHALDVDRSPTLGPVATPEPEWEAPSEGDLVGRIRIDRLGISAIVHHGTTARTLRRAVGHIPGTALPGEEGNVGLAGHRDSFFRGLGEIREGDLVRLETLFGDLTYEVERTLVVAPDAVHVLDPPSAGEIVTLVTCHPFHWVGPAPDRFIVHARRIPERDSSFPGES